MSKRKEDALKEKKRFSKRELAIFSIIFISIIILGSIVSLRLLQNPISFSLDAAIVDQLGGEFPSSKFNETGIVADLLKSAGFDVCYHGSETIDVAFYKGLAKYDYGIIIIRSHLATRVGETTEVDFFTNEKFNLHKHVSEQKNGLLTEGYYEWRPNESYFAVTPKFMENLEGYFPKSVVIAMGCNSLNESCTEMAKAFIEKGATAYIGWTGKVGSSHTDDETIKLLERLLLENKTLSKAVDATQQDPFSGSIMKYHPLEAGGLRISCLIAEVKEESNYQSHVNFFEPTLSVCNCRVMPKINRIINLTRVKQACQVPVSFRKNRV